jgi:PKD repeat protein
MTKHHLWKLVFAIAVAVSLAAPGVSATSMVFDSPIPHDPTNDNFDSAISITSLPYSDAVVMAGATIEPNEPQYCSGGLQTVWYSYTPSMSQTVKVTPSGFYDMNLVIYQAVGTNIADWSMINCASWDSPSLTFVAVAGITYYFQVGSIYGSGQTAQVTVEAVLPPVNDNFADATTISETLFSQSVNVGGATTESGEPLNNCFYSVQDTVWYKFIAPGNGSVYASLSGTWWGETPLSIYRADGEGLGGLSPSLGCNTQGGFNVNVEAGKTYYFQAGTFGWVSGYLDFSMSFTPTPPPPANDNFADATNISGTYFYEMTNVTGATTEFGEPGGGCYNQPQHTVWYSFTPSDNGAVSASIWGSNGDTILNAYRADDEGLGGLSSSLGCTTYTGNFWFPVQADKTYYFQAGTMWSAGGDLQFNMSFLPAPANDNFAAAKVIESLPYDDSTDMTAASTEAGEPAPSCGSTSKTVWYAYTPTESGSLSQRTDTWSYTVAGVYTGSSVDTLTEVACRSRYYDSSFLTFHVDAGTTYYFQVGTNENTWLPFHLEVAPPPVAEFGYGPSDPSIFDTIGFYGGTYDPAGVGIQSWSWNFGDGTTATGQYVTHRYAADGNYTVNLTINTPDGRTAATSQAVSVKTHDVTIAKFTVPQSAKAGQTRQLVVGISNKRYPEEVDVQLYKSYPGYGWQWVGTLHQSVPVRSGNRTTEFSFNYTFTAEDAVMGKVTFRTVATITSARDALPGDNEVIALPTKVTKK